MHRTQILLEPEQYEALCEIARKEKRSLSEVIREMVDRQIAERNRNQLADAARILLADYQSDPELTAFQTLNGDDFNAQG